MKQAIVFLAILAVCSSTKLKPGLKVTFGIGPGEGTRYFYDVPRTMQAVRANNWTQVERPPSPMPSLVMWCTPGVHYLCVLFDPKTQTLVGLQVSLPLNEFSGEVFDWYLQGFIPWTPANANCTKPVTYMTKQMYFMSEETLMKSRVERRKKSASDHVLQQDELWLMGFKQELMRISTNVTGIEQSGFTRQACYPRMGQHFFFKMNRYTKCASDTILNWFLITDPEDCKLIAVAFTVMGFMPKKEGQKNYFEQSTRALTETIVKYRPDCVLELADNPGITSMHIYFTDEPGKIQCPSS